MSSPVKSGDVVAKRVSQPIGSDFPSPAEWRAALAVLFSTDWRGENADPQLETEVRLLWSDEALYLHFAAKYRAITVFADCDANGRRDQMWDRDVAEAFLQPPGSPPDSYKEFEVSPSGQWIDLDISAGRKRDLESGLRRRAAIDSTQRIWRAELAIPMKSLTAAFEPSEDWRANFYRVEGPSEPRFYSAWRPTMTREPNFHVPEAFGRLLFSRA